MSADGHSVSAGAVTGVADRVVAVASLPAVHPDEAVAGRCSPESGVEVVVVSPEGLPDALRETGREIVHATRE